MKVVFFVSRNKDNRDVPNFKERKETFFQKAQKTQSAALSTLWKMASLVNIRVIMLA